MGEWWEGENESRENCGVREALREPRKLLFAQLKLAKAKAAQPAGVCFIG